MRKTIRLIILGTLALILAGLLWTGYEVHSVYSDLKATYHPVPRIAFEPKATPVTDFFGRHRINILLLGSDDDSKFAVGNPLTQSMIVVSIDPVHDKVTMLSIPRDFWVPIPGYGMGKIDTASEQGGVSLARATVETLFHLNIDYYAWVGLNGFSQVVDDFGGVTIDVTHPILDDFYPNDRGSSDPYAYTRVFIAPGWRHLSGRQALEYVRSRHGDAVGDFGRSQRQQQVLLQLEKKPAGWNLVFAIPQLIHHLKSMIRTDLGPTRLFDLARLARHIHPSDVTQVVLSAPTYCQYSTTPDGQSILLPNWTAIQPVVNRLFAPIPLPSAPAPSALSTNAGSAPATPRPVPVVRTPPTARSTATPRLPSLRELPGTLLYAAGGTFYEIDPHRRVTDVMPSWMTAAAMPAISPDATTLAFLRWSTYASDIYAYNLQIHHTPAQLTNDASPDPQVVNNYMWAAWPAWSPDGKTILFSSDSYKLQSLPSESRMVDLAIYAMNADGTNLRQLTVPDLGAGGDTDPQFLGHSSRYLYDHWAYHWQNGVALGQPYSQLMIRDLNNPAAVWTLTPPSGQIIQPALNRSGTLLAYVQPDGNVSRLIVARLANSSKGPQLRHQKIIATGEITQPAFSPNGRWVSYLSAQGDGFALYLEPTGGGPSFKINEVGDGVDALSRPVWIP